MDPCNGDIHRQTISGEGNVFNHGDRAISIVPAGIPNREISRLFRFARRPDHATTMHPWYVNRVANANISPNNSIGSSAFNLQRFGCVPNTDLHVDIVGSQPGGLYGQRQTEACIVQIPRVPTLGRAFRSTPLQTESILVNPNAAIPQRVASVTTIGSNSIGTKGMEAESPFRQRDLQVNLSSPSQGSTGSVSVPCAQSSSVQSMPRGRQVQNPQLYSRGSLYNSGAFIPGSGNPRTGTVPRSMFRPTLLQLETCSTYTGFVRAAQHHLNRGAMSQTPHHRYHSSNLPDSVRAPNTSFIANYSTGSVNYGGEQMAIPLISTTAVTSEDTCLSGRSCSTPDVVQQRFVLAQEEVTKTLVIPQFSKISNNHGMSHTAASSVSLYGTGTRGHQFTSGQQVGYYRVISGYENTPVCNSSLVSLKIPSQVPQNEESNVSIHKDRTPAVAKESKALTKRRAPYKPRQRKQALIISSQATVAVPMSKEHSVIPVALDVGSTLSSGDVVGSLGHGQNQNCTEQSITSFNSNTYHNAVDDQRESHVTEEKKSVRKPSVARKRKPLSPGRKERAKLQKIERQNLTRQLMKEIAAAASNELENVDRKQRRGSNRISESCNERAPRPITAVVVVQEVKSDTETSCSVPSTNLVQDFCLGSISVESNKRDNGLMDDVEKPSDTHRFRNAWERDFHFAEEALLQAIALQGHNKLETGLDACMFSSREGEFSSPIGSGLQFVHAHLQQIEDMNVIPKVLMMMNEESSRSDVIIIDVRVFEGGDYSQYPPLKVQVTSDYPAEIPAFLQLSSLSATIANSGLRRKFEHAVSRLRKWLITIRDHQCTLPIIIPKWASIINETDHLRDFDEAVLIDEVVVE